MVGQTAARRAAGVILKTKLKVKMMKKKEKGFREKRGEELREKKKRRMKKRRGESSLALLHVCKLINSSGNILDRMV